MGTPKKSQVSSLFHDSHMSYDELYVAYAFFDHDMRAVMRTLPWNMPVRESAIFKSFHGTPLKSGAIKRLFRLLSGAGVILRSSVEKIHVSMMFTDILHNRHRIPKKYLSRFFNNASRRSFNDVLNDFECDDNEDYTEMLDSPTITSSPFIAEFLPEDTISKFIESVGAVVTRHRYASVQAIPCCSHTALLHLYFSILFTLTGVRGVKIDKLYAMESAFSPWSIFGIFEWDLPDMVRRTPGLVYEDGVVWIVDISFYNVYPLVNQYTSTLNMNSHRGTP